MISIHTTEGTGREVRWSGTLIGTINGPTTTDPVWEAHSTAGERIGRYDFGVDALLAVVKEAGVVPLPEVA